MSTCHANSAGCIVEVRAREQPALLNVVQRLSVSASKLSNAGHSSIEDVLHVFQRAGKVLVVAWIPPLPDVAKHRLRLLDLPPGLVAAVTAEVGVGVPHTGHDDREGEGGRLVRGKS